MSKLGKGDRQAKIRDAVDKYAAAANEQDPVRHARQINQSLAGRIDEDPAAIEAMSKPVLVRVVDENLTEQEIRDRSRKYNETQTQAMQTEAEGLSRSNMISLETLAAFAEDMEDFDSLAEYLNSGRSSRLLAALLKDGVITQQEINALTKTNDTSSLNDRGKSVVTAALRGLIVPDYELLKGLEGDLQKAVDRTIPAMTRLRAKGGKWDLTNVLTAALREIQAAKANGKRLTEWLYQGDLTGKNPDREKPAVQALAILLDNVTRDKVSQKEVQTRFDLFADTAMKDKPNALMGARKGAEADAFIASFLTPVARVGKNTIANFDPANNPAHEAIQWASENGGAKAKAGTAQNKLDDILKSTEYTEEGKQKARERIRHLADLDKDATIAVYQPNLGQSFGYRKGQELWQSVEATVPEESIQAVRRQYEGTEAWMKAPNGQPTNLTERQWLQVRTPEFKAWFGDWETLARKQAIDMLVPVDITGREVMQSKDDIKNFARNNRELTNSMEKGPVIFAVEKAGKLAKYAQSSIIMERPLQKFNLSI